jgi:multimeric flavodoxin WrbA
MKVIAFNGSPHAAGNTAAAIRIVAKELEADGIEVETVHVGAALIHGCTGCNSCKKTHRCIIGDDIVNGCIDKVNEADGLILASPTYYAGVAGTMKSFLDRLFYAGADARYKAATAVVTVRRSGGVPAFQQLNNYLNLAQALVVPSFYWNVAHGNAEGELTEDGEGTQVLENLGRNMVWLMRSLEGASEPPPQVKRVRTNFVR